MAYPPLVNYETIEEYRCHFEKVYCRRPIMTFDGIRVRFRKRDFNHCLYDSIRERDNTFSRQRAMRIDWIKVALQDPDAELYVGWDNKRKRNVWNRRVALVMENYVVVIKIVGSDKAEFHTAFVADPPKEEGQLSTIDKIRTNPRWSKKNR